MLYNFKKMAGGHGPIRYVLRRLWLGVCMVFGKTGLKRIGSIKLRIKISWLLKFGLAFVVIWFPSGDVQGSEENPIYAVSKFKLSYARGSHPSHPPLNTIMNYEIELERIGDQFVSPEPGKESVEIIRLSDLTGVATKKFQASAIQSINEQIVGYLNSLGIIGVYVEPLKEDIDKKTLKDLRPINDTELHLVIWTSFIKEMRTLASGKRIPESERINNPAHARILELSPLKPASQTPGSREDLLKKDLLDEFVFRLNRHSGRRVDIAVSSTGEPGDLVLDYLVSENKPWLAYAQISNTGTESTDRVRERFGVIFNQFTKNDDIFSLDYITAGFDEAHAVVGSYEFPMLSSERLRVRIFGAWNEFTASELGGTLPLDLEGDSWNTGAEFVLNIFQHKQLFVDLVFGAQFENISVDNRVVQDEGESDFIIPHFELQMEHITDTANSFASLDLEWIKADLDNENSNDSGINKLGRIDPEDDPAVLHWNIQHSLYLEPLLFRKRWKDPQTWKSSTLAHELAFSFKGQFAFDNRLVPQKQMTAGGFYSVRGYEESETVGDDVYLGSIEYRLHVPRVFKPTEPKNLFPRSLSGKHGSRKPKPFRLVPDRVYGRPDWDFIIRAFYDLGDTEVTDRRKGNGEFEDQEFDEFLQSAGIGLEVQLLQNFNFRLDWAYVLQGLDGGDTDNGDDRLHVAATFLW